MKTMKKLASAALALILTLALAVPAMAKEETGSITVTNPAPEQTYGIYRIFDLESYGSGENAPHSYKVNDTWREFVNSEGIKDVYVVIDDQEYVTWVEEKNNADGAAEFAEKALDWAEAHSMVPLATQKAGPALSTEGDDPRAAAITFSGETVALGYYLISSSRGTLCALNTTNSDANVTEKNVKPTVDKEEDEDEKEGNEPGIGDSVPYKVTVHAKKGAKSYVVHDTMTTGLKFNNDVKVYVGESEIDAANYTVKTEGTCGCTFEVVFEQAYLDTLTADNTDIVIKYSATITAEAAGAVDPITNKAQLEYGNGDKTEETLEPDVPHYLYEFDVVKTTSNGTKLDGATFTLYDAATEGNQIQLVKEGNYYRPATAEEKAVEGFTSAIIETTNGVANIKGLGAGTYYLQEEAAPAGYNKLKERQEVSLTANLNANETATTDTVDGRENVQVWGGVQVYNFTGMEMPETGGIGTTIFYIVGGLLVAGAGVLLVTRKRMSGEEE